MRRINGCAFPPRRHQLGALALAGISVLLAPGPVPAAELNRAAPGAAEHLTLWQAVERATASHPSVGAARAQRDAATASVGEAEAGLRPRVSLVASATQYDEAMVVTPIHAFDLGQTPEFDETLLQAAAQVSYTLFDGGERGAQIRQSRAEADVAGAGLRGYEQAIIARTVNVYLSALNLREILAAHDQRLAALLGERDRVRQRLEVGRAPEVELRRIEATVAAARAERVSLGAALKVTESDLARLVDSDVDQTRAHRLVEVRLAQIDLGDRQVLTQRAIGSSPLVEQARKRLQAAEAGVALARGKRLPDLEVIGKYTDFGSSQGNFSSEWSAGLRLTVPVYAGGAARQRIAKTEAHREAASQELRLTILRVGEELDRALSNLEQAHATRASLEAAARSFSEVARIERLRLDVGSGTQTEFLDAEAELLTVRADLARVRHTEIATRAELARVVGELELGWLRRNLEVAP